MVERAIRNKAKKAHTRALLIEAAKHIFSKHGFEKSRITGITELAGVSAGTFYEYYKNKDEIFLEIVKEVNHELRQRIASFNKKWKQSKTLKDRTRVSVSLVFDFFDNYPYYAPIVAMGGHSGFDVVNEAYALLTENIFAAIKTYYQTGAQHGDLRQLEPDIVIRAILGTFTGVVNLYLDGDFSRDQMIETLTEFISEGILTKLCLD